MEPINKKERRKALTRFSILFVISVIIVALIIFFTLKFPQSENLLLRNQNQEMRDQFKFQKDYIAVKMVEMNELLEKMKVRVVEEGEEAEEVDIDKLNSRLGSILAEMEIRIEADTSWRKDFHTLIIEAYTDLKKARNDLIEKEEVMAELSEELDKCKVSLSRAGAAKEEDSMGL